MRDEKPSAAAAKSPDYVLRILRQRRGLDANDPSLDAGVEALPPHAKLRETAAWEPGSPAWADIFLRWAKDCGYEIGPMAR